MRRLQYDLQPGQAEVRLNIPAGPRPDGSVLTVDLYLPIHRPQQPLPIALLLHGALPDFIPIRPAQWRMFPDWGMALAQSGAAAVMFNHQLGWPEHRLDEAVAEIEIVMQWLSDSALTERLDLTRLTIVAYSGGGLLVPELVRRYDHKRIRGYALLYPLLAREADRVNSDVVVARLRFVDVLPLLAERRTPLLLFRSGADEIPQLLAIFDSAVAEALKLDARLELVNLPSAPHGFDSLLANADTLRAIERTIQFVML